jgi:hypothetical protein
MGTTIQFPELPRVDLIIRFQPIELRGDDWYCLDFAAP